jgi:hypothetical protein
VVSAADAVSEFEHRHDRNGDSFVASFQRHSFVKLSGVLALAFGGDNE